MYLFAPVVYVSSVFALIFLATGCSQKNEVPELSSSQRKLNDTGITWGGNYPKDINEDCSASINPAGLPAGEMIEGDILAGQDCMQGRDALLLDSENGAAGFSYKKINSSGEILAADAQAWDCVLDEVSGLLWEVKKPADGQYGNLGLHDADDLFTWYNSNSKKNAGAIGDWNARAAQCAEYIEGQPMTYCNIEEFVSRVNRDGLCSFSDWRVPTRPELETLINFGRTMPAIDTHYFPNTQNQFYWSDSPVVTHSESAWGVSFQFGFSAHLQRSNGRSVRLVRKPAKGDIGEK